MNLGDVKKVEQAEDGCRWDVETDGEGVSLMTHRFLAWMNYYGVINHKQEGKEEEEV